MEFEFLDSESENLLEELLESDSLISKPIMGDTIEFLVIQNYVEGVSARALEDTCPCYIISGVTQKGRSYFELKKRYEKEKRRLTRREWKIAIISAIVGAIIGLMPTIINWFNI